MVLGEPYEIYHMRVLGWILKVGLGLGRVGDKNAIPLSDLEIALLNEQIPIDRCETVNTKSVLFTVKGKKGCCSDALSCV